MGDVYRARDTRAGRTVAIKVVSEEIAAAPERRGRFLEDARLATRLSHPNIATLYEVGDEDGRLYLAYEFVQGQTLRALVGGRPLNPRRAVNLASQIADALAEAHAVDIAHGDINADAIIVTPKGHAKVLDVGLASWATGASSRASASANRRDISGLGVILFEMLTGAAPAPGAQVSRIIVRAIPPELDPIVAKAIGEDGSYASAAALAGELRVVAALLDVRKEASEASAPPAVVARSKRSRGGLAVLGVVLVALGVLAWWYFRTG